MTQKIGIYGGSFNPLHNAHIETAEWLVDNNYVDEVMLMVNPCNPFKLGNDMPDVYFRMKAAEIGVKAFEKEKYKHDVHVRKVWVSNFEATRFFGQETCYTVDSLKKLLYESVFFDEEFYFILGVDTFNDIEKFKDWEWFLESKLVKFIILPRKGYALHSGVFSKFKEIATYVDEAPYIEMSSTEVRNLLKNKEYDKLKQYMPQEEIDYIKEQKIYE